MPAKKAKKQIIKYSYDFGKKTDGSSKLRELLGGKGANLAEMARIGLPVPPGFTLTTEVCTYFYENKRTYPKSLEKEVIASVTSIEKELGKKLGAAKNPLLLSVRSGARESMPGMMDTILNLGLNDKTVKALANESGNEAFAYDCYRRFIQMYGDVVMGVQARSENEHCPFEETLEKLRKEAGVELDNQLTAHDLKELIQRYKAVIKKRTGKMSVLYCIAKSTVFLLLGELLLMFKQWYLETWVTTAPLVLHSLVILQTAKKYSMVNILSTLRVKMLLLVFAHRIQLYSLRMKCQKPMMT